MLWRLRNTEYTPGLPPSSVATQQLRIIAILISIFIADSGGGDTSVLLHCSFFCLTLLLIDTFASSHFETQSSNAVFELLCLRLSFFRMYICLFLKGFLSAFCTIFLPASVYKQPEKLVSFLFESF